jgi:hypothetical protein
MKSAAGVQVPCDGSATCIAVFAGSPGCSTLEGVDAHGTVGRPSRLLCEDPSVASSS